ncbi:MAG: hypothetical protein JRG80_07075 [Deltaproteobacteria bacterium]|nr:hypothetical protein [Deltaproteobacteria bacterium]
MEVFVTNEDEWYKAAYYETGAMIYLDYPAGSDTQMTCTVPGAAANTANCGDAVGDLTDVGSYTAAASPGGTFDQGGNLFEWNEAIFGGSYRGLRGGYYYSFPSSLAASLQLYDLPTFEEYGVGFRVASPVPAPAVPSLSPIGLLVVAAGLLGFGALRPAH